MGIDQPEDPAEGASTPRLVRSCPPLPPGGASSLTHLANDGVYPPHPHTDLAYDGMYPPLTDLTNDGVYPPHPDLAYDGVYPNPPHTDGVWPYRTLSNGC